jgi:NADH:ubiquinone oxidoreductase subunit C
LETIEGKLTWLKKSTKINEICATLKEMAFLAFDIHGINSVERKNQFSLFNISKQHTIFLHHCYLCGVMD